jgi:transposase InsO family protein
VHLPHRSRLLLFANTLGRSIVAVCFTHRFLLEYEFATDRILLGKRYLILNRDAKYCHAFRDFVKREGIEVIRLPPRSPNLNAYAERWVRGVRDECLSRLIPIRQGTLRRALREYGAHFHQERNHQGLGNVLIMSRASSANREGPLVRRQRLGGLLNLYGRAAA